MKNLILLFIILISSIGSADAQNESINDGQLPKGKYYKMAAAHDYSATGEGIGIYMKAGNEYDDISDERIKVMFENTVKSQGIVVEVFIDRTDDRNSSLYKCFVDGEGVGITSTVADFSNYLKQAIANYWANRKVVKNIP